MILLLIIGVGLFDRIEAVAGDDILLKSELDELSLFYGGADTTRRIIRDELVNRALVVKLAERETIEVRDEEVEGLLSLRFEQLKDQLGGDEILEEECRKRGITVMELRDRYFREIRSQLLLRKFLEKKSHPYLLVTPTEVREFYDRHKDSIAIRPGTVVLKHILLLIQPSPEAIGAAAKKIAEVYDLLQRGGDFAVLAQEFSDDPYSRRRGGLLGRIRRGDLVEEFEQVVFSLKPGEISQPFQTRFGFHIAEVLSKDGESVLVRQILVAVKTTPEDTIRTKQLAMRLIERLKRGADFDSLARIYSQDPMAKQGQTTLGEFIEEQIPEPFREKISDLAEGEISEPILSPYGYHIIKIANRTPRKILSFRDLRERIENYLREQKYQREYERWAERAKKEIFHLILNED